MVVSDLWDEELYVARATSSTICVYSCALSCCGLIVKTFKFWRQRKEFIFGRAGASPPSLTTWARCLYVYILYNYIYIWYDRPDT